MVALIVATACSGGGSGDDIKGVWELNSFQVGDEVTEVEIGVNTPNRPWVEFNEQMTGDLGCNGFGGSYEFSDGILTPGEIFSELSLCLDRGGMTTEDLIHEQFLRRSSVGVTVSERDMVWSAGASKLFWHRIDTPPPPETIPPQTSIGPLDCGDRVVEEQRVASDGSDFQSHEAAGDALMDEFPGVVSADRSDPSSLVWYGYDDSGEAIAVLSFNDDGSDTFSIFTCP